MSELSKQLTVIVLKANSKEISVYPNFNELLTKTRNYEN